MTMTDQCEEHVESLGLVSVDDACRILGMKRSWVYEAAWRGELPSYRLGRSVRFRLKELEEYIESRRQSAPC